MFWPRISSLFIAEHSLPWMTGADEPSESELALVEDERQEANDLEDPEKPGEPPVSYPVIEQYDEAAKAKYKNGKNKRRRYRRVNLKSRKVVIVLHQMGVERSARSKRWHYTTGHRVIDPAGNRRRLHPLDVRLVAANRLDRKPYHAITIEIAGNFEGVEGSGNWWAPDRFGRGKLSKPQIEACRQEVFAIIQELRQIGVEVWAIMPHIVSGRDRKGRPNRPLCPGSAVWSQIGEYCARRFSLATPGATFTAGGAPIPEAWRGPHWRGGEGLTVL